MIATSGNAPYSSMDELAAYAKSNKVTLGHFGEPLIPTKVTKAVAKIMDFEWVHWGGSGMRLICWTVIL